MAQYQLPRGTFPANYGDLLRANQLGEGLSWGGSDLEARPDVSQDQIAKALGLATNPPSAAPTISNQDAFRFLAQQSGGGLPGLPGVGGGGEDMSGGRAPTDPGSFFTTPNGEQVALEGVNGPGRGNVSDLGNLPEVTDMGTPGGRSGIQAAIDAAVNAINSPTGQTALDLASLTGYGAIPAAAAKIAGRLGGRFGFGGPPAPEPTVETLNETLSGAFRGSTPEAQAQFAAQRSGERAPDVMGNREDVGPTAPPNVPDNTSSPDAPGVPTGPPDSPAGQVSGGELGISADAPTAPDTGSPGPGPSGGGGSSGDSGTGDEARGGFIPRRTNIRGSFKGVKHFQGGGAVTPPTLYRNGGVAAPMSERQARLNRIAAFEKVHGAHSI